MYDNEEEKINLIGYEREEKYNKVNKSTYKLTSNLTNESLKAAMGILNESTYKLTSNLTNESLKAAMGIFNESTYKLKYNLTNESLKAAIGIFNKSTNEFIEKISTSNNLNDSDFREVEEIISNMSESINNVNEKGNNEVHLTLEQKLNSRIERAKKKNPIISKIVILYITYIFNSIIQMQIDLGGNLIKEAFNKVYSIEYNISDVKNEIYGRLNNEFDWAKKLILNSYRYINKDNVAIRINHFMDSRIVVKVNSNDSIRLIKNSTNTSKKRYKNWLYVEYQKDNKVYNGWINNIYTSKI